ncbi:putative aminopeptidase W07G4.4 [Lingula anatina]|uniref:Aminopeptidase W07G4.4 n=1 Tax=Lingula anatina TaxID=7574 RepID=A0A1S3I7F0_LINAN|nr:putative aminopeptidase W07G4.4 [Lingula anatina]|eukprot:XP_013394128.1 putative aminopeptidase W07G4.4 [Lingula anatina]
MTDIRVPCTLVPCLDVADAQYDAVVVVTDSIDKLTGNLENIKAVLQDYEHVDGKLENPGFVHFIKTDVVPSKRLIFAPTGPLNRDYDDVRRFADAANRGINRAVAAGSNNPLLVRPVDDSFPKAGLVTSLGAMQVLYVPIEVREDVPSRARKVNNLGVWCNDQTRVVKALPILNGLEKGRSVCRDIGGSDPERMAAPRVAQYVQDVFKGTCIKVNILSDPEVFKKEYPLLAAVNRSAGCVERHRGHVIFLEYVGEGDIDTTLLLVGKGITYDTGGADIKAGGVMAGMHRDKCGAAAVAGFFQVLDSLKPKGLKVLGAMSMVRNSVGSECYVADEIITSRAGVRVRVGNTDAEGRMVMADVLCQMKEKALNEVNPHLFTIATLTGHAIRAMGPNYSIILDNGPASKEQTSQKMQAVGSQYGDPFEISNIRREDYEFHKGKSEYEDVLQCNNLPSTMTPRGHQTPAAFMIMASGLDKHGIDSERPLKYSHMDIAGSSGPFPGVPTGSPVVAMAARYVLDRVA